MGITVANRHYVVQSESELTLFVLWHQFVSRWKKVA